MRVSARWRVASGASVVFTRGMRVMRIVRLLLLPALTLGLIAGVFAADEKVTIKEVMKKAMAGGLCKKCASGKASDAEKKELVELFSALGKSKPPKGDEASWKEKTDKLVAAAKAVAEGKDDGAKALGAAANCMACHSVHKGK